MAEVRIVQRRTFLEVERARGDASPVCRHCRALSDAEIEYGGAESDNESFTTTVGSRSSPMDALTTCSVAGMDTESVSSWAPGESLSDVLSTFGAASMDTEFVGSVSNDLLSECEQSLPVQHIPGISAVQQTAHEPAAVRQPGVWAYAQWTSAWGSLSTQVAPCVPQAPLQQELWRQDLPWEQDMPMQQDLPWQHAVSLSRPATRRRGRRRTGKSPEPTPVQHTNAKKFVGVGLDVPESEWTTIIFRNVPPSVKRDIVARALDVAGFSGEYDFVHVPVKYEDSEGIGYALVNAIYREAAENIMRHFQGFAAWPVERRAAGSKSQNQQVDAAWSVPLQGLAAQIARYRDSPVMHECMPVVFKPALFNRQGMRIAFPPPTKKLKPPRLRKAA